MITREQMEICPSKTKEYKREYTEKYYKCYPWKKHYKNILSRCNGKNKPYRKRGIKNFLSVEDVKYLWDRDYAEGLTSPSIDRKDSRGNYTIENSRFIELSENRRRSKISNSPKVKLWKRKPVNQYDLKDKFIRRWDCQAEASQKLGLNFSLISACAREVRNQTGGFKWKFAK